MSKGFRSENFCRTPPGLWVQVLSINVQPVFCSGESSGNSDFLSQSKLMCGRLIGISKFHSLRMCVCDCAPD